MSGEGPSKSENQLILAIEASGDASAAAILRADGQIFQEIHHAKHGHAERLIGQITSVLAQAHCTLNEITHIAAGCGPGSFTGMRVCLATAQGLLLASAAQAIGVNGLAALAHSAGPSATRPVLAVVDSRRRSVYAHLAGGETDVQLPAPELDDMGLLSLLQSSPNLRIVGALPEGWPEGWPEGLPAGTRYEHKVLDAAMVAQFAESQIKAQAVLPPLSPLYLAPPKLGPSKSDSPKPESVQKAEAGNRPDKPITAS